MADFTAGNKVVVGTPQQNYSPFNGAQGERVARDGDGRLWACSFDSSFAVNSWVIHYSDDNGSSWSAGEIIFTGSGVNDIIRQSAGICVDNDGKPVVSIRNPSVLTQQRFYRREGDDVTPAWTLLGAVLTWGSNIHFEDGRNNFIQDPSTGDWHIFYLNPSDNTELYTRISTDNLVTWGSPTSIFNSAFQLRGPGRSMCYRAWFDSAGDLFLAGFDRWNSSTVYSPRVFRWNGSSWARWDTGTLIVFTSNDGADFILTEDESHIVAIFGTLQAGTRATYSRMLNISGSGWDALPVPSTLGIQFAYPRLTRSADGILHLAFYAVALPSVLVKYYRTSSEGASWPSTAEDMNSSFSTNVCAQYFVHPSNSLHYPSVGAAAVGFHQNVETWYIASDDIEWPAVAVGTRITRFVVRTLGETPDPIRPLTLPTDLPPMLQVNWEPGIELETTFQSDVTVSHDSVSEDRRSLMERPFRTLSATILATNKSESWRLISLIARHAQARSVVPLYTDHSRVTASSSSTNIWCNTRWRRFFKGGRVVIFDWVDNRPANVEYHIISKLATNRIVTVDALATTHPVNARVMPVLDVEVALNQFNSLLSDEVSEIRLTAVEVIGYSAFPSLTSGDPPDFQTHDGAPVVDILPDWSDEIQFGVQREGESTPVGRGRVVSTYGVRPRFVYSLTYGFFSRESAWRMLRFLESRRGRVRPFWIIGAAHLFEIDDISTTYVDIEASGDFDDLEDFIPYVAIVMWDGVVYIRTIASYTDNTTTWRLTFDTSIDSVAVADVRKVTSAHFVRLNSDTYRERWVTDETVFVRVQVIDLLAEQDVEIDL